VGCGVGCGAGGTVTERGAAAAPNDVLDISLEHGSEDEAATAAQLRRLASTYDLRPWCYTRKIVIDRDATPHSHPVLMLHTRHRHDDLLLLSTFIHEESHWYVDAHRDAASAALDAIRPMLPSLPVGFPDGADNERSSYEHLIIIALEERGLQRLAGELAARQAMDFWAGDHYRVLYRTVPEHRREIRTAMKAKGLGSPDEP
jgi:hypothetical protein